jgi:hypothetical protein
LCPILASHALEVSSAGIASGVTFQWNCISASLSNLFGEKERRSGGVAERGWGISPFGESLQSANSRDSRETWAGAQRSRPAESAWDGAADAPRSRVHALHAGELAPLLRCASIILPAGDDRRLTELSNVVAYPCRHSRAEDRRHAHRSAFFGCPSTGDQSFSHQRFPSAKTGCANCANCANPRHGPPIRYPRLA